MLTERERQEVRRTAKKHRSAPNIVNAASIPARGADDAYGNPFLGIPANRLKALDVSDAELASGAAIRRVIANNAVGTDEADSAFLEAKHFKGGGPSRLPEGVKIRLASDVDGALDVNNLGGGGGGHKIDKDLLPNMGNLNGSLPTNRLAGNISRGQLDNNLNGDQLIRDGTLPVSALAGRPWGSKTEPSDVVRLIRKHVKATSLR